MILTPRIVHAQTYALRLLQNKEYGDGIPYSVHLFLVVSYIHQFLVLSNIPRELWEDVIIAAWLHDVREDAGISYNEIKKLFGERVAEIVYSVTNEDGRDREEKAIKTYPKTAKNRLGVFVKLADRIANTVYSKMNQNSMFNKYVKEFKFFKISLFEKGEYDAIWSYLETIVSDEEAQELLNRKNKKETV